MRRTFILTAFLAVAACGSSTKPVAKGGACSPSQGCADGLTCHDSICVDASTSAGDGSDNGGDSGSNGSTMSTTNTSTTEGSSSTGTTSNTTSNSSSASSTNGSSTSSTTTNSNTTSSTGSSGTTSATTTSTSGSTGTSGGCGACNTPPDDCHSTVGSCQNGQCVYDFVEGASCDDGNPCTVQDTCHAGSCAGSPMVCDTPPNAVCNGSQLATYDASGVCQGGRCVYTPQSVSCGTGGCSNGACQTDPCGSITCNQPPSVCFTSSGTCSQGACSYGYADGATCDDGDACTTNDSCDTGVCRGTPKACLSPPASSCSDANTAKIYTSSGTCSQGNCSYTYNFVTCPNGCTGAGICNGGGWTKMTSNANADLHSAWGTSASDVWVGGASGTLLHWNGAQWSAKSSGVTGDIVSINGTASNNIFAVASDHNYYGSLIHYDGTSWSSIGGQYPLGTYFDMDYAAAVIAVGPKEAYVGGDSALLHAFPDGGLSPVQLPSGTYYLESYEGGGGWNLGNGHIWFSLGYVWDWDGTNLTEAGGAFGSGPIWAVDPSHVYTAQDGNVNFWNGSTWTLLNTGLSGNVTGIWGTSSTRVFASAAFDPYPSGASSGFVLLWDGSGWTQQTLPANTLGLRAIYAAPTGEVFATGDTGTILKGP